MRTRTILGILSLAVASPLLAENRNSGIDRKGFDRSVRVQDDLFLHVNGKWLEETAIPADKSNYGSFIVLIDEAQANLRAIIEATAETAAPANSEARKVGDFFRSYMNEALVNQRGLKPLAQELGEIDHLASKRDVIKYLGHLQVIGVRGPIGFFVDQDDKNSTQYLAGVVQSGTTLPDRNYYLKDDQKYKKARAALQKHVKTLFSLSKLPGGEEAAAAILKLETELARVQWERAELRNAEKRYNKYAVKDLPELTPKLKWGPFFAAVGAADITEVNVLTPSFFSGLESIIETTPLAVWQQYLRFQLIDSYATVLPQGFVESHFQLHQKELAGVPQMQPRWKQAVDATSGKRAGDFGVLGAAVGKIFVKKHFPESAKQRMDQLVKNLLTTYGQSIRELTWMTPVTKKRALEKLKKINTKIGYPEKPRGYEGLEIKPDDLLGNVMRSARYEHQRMMKKLGKPVDRGEWGMTPQTVNAYYNPSLNEIVFPAAILQPPFFNPQADDAVNYGGIGAVIGHEISHAFDDQGSKYDGDGNLNDWWTDEDRSAFQKLTGKLVDQYAAYQPLPGKPINGKLTLGENIADLSGMSIAHKAYRMSLGDKPAPKIDGWTGDQRFFLGWGQIWRRKYRDAEMIRRLLIDPHSPSRFRSNGPVSNLDSFYRAFDVKPGDRLYKPKEERIRIW